MSQHLTKRGSIVRAFGGELTGIMAEAAGAIRRLTPSQLAPGSSAVLERFRKPMADTILAGNTASAHLGVVAGGDLLEGLLGVDTLEDFQLAAANQQAAEWAARQSGTRITQVHATTVARVRSEVEAGINAGLKPGQIADRLEGVETGGGGVLGRKRAVLIATTEVTESYAAANIATWRESGLVEELGWRTSNDERVCPICAPLGGLVWQPAGRAAGGAKPASIGNQVKKAATTDINNPAFRHPGGRGAAGKFRGRTYEKPPAHPGCRCSLVPIITGAGAPQATPPKPKPKPKPAKPPVPAAPPTPPAFNPHDPAAFAKAGAEIRKAVDKRLGVITDKAVLQQEIAKLDDRIKDLTQAFNEVQEDALFWKAIGDKKWPKTTGGHKVPPELKALYKRRQQLRYQLNGSLAKTEREIADAVREELQARGVTFGKVKVDVIGDGGKASAELAQETAEYLNKYVPDHLIRAAQASWQPQVKVVARPSGFRAHYDWRTNEIHAANGYEARTAVHEYFHHLQSTVEGLEEIAQQTFVRMTVGNKRRAIYGSESYGVKAGDVTDNWYVEAGMRDDFPHGYFGKTYRANKQSGYGLAEELTPLTSDALLVGNDWTRQLWMDNKDLVDTFLGMLADTRWKPAEYSIRAATWHGAYNPLVVGKLRKEAYDEAHNAAP